LNVGERDSAQAAFQRTVDYGVRFPQIPDAAKLGDRAREEMIAAEMPVAESAASNEKAETLSQP
jgi:hypothetical protein